MFIDNGFQEHCYYIKYRMKEVPFKKNRSKFINRLGGA